MANKGFSINSELSNQCSDGTMVTINEYLTYLDIESNSYSSDPNIENEEFKFEEKYAVEFAQSSLKVPLFGIADITKYDASDTLLLTFLVDSRNWIIEVGKDQTFLTYTKNINDDSDAVPEYVPANELYVDQFIYSMDGNMVGQLISSEHIDATNTSTIVTVKPREDGLSIHKDVDGVKLSNNIVLGF